MLDKLVLSGTPYEQGFTHGKEFSDEISSNISFYQSYFTEKGLSREGIREKAEKLYPIIEEKSAEYAEAIEGVSDGSGLPIEEIISINIRHTISYSAFSDQINQSNETTTDLTDGCTSFGVMPHRTCDNHTYLGQNWDWYEPVEQFIMDIRNDNSPNIIALTEAGLVGAKYGVNEHGIGYAANGMSTPQDGENYLRTPSHVRSYELLHAERFDQVLSSIVSELRPTARNYLIGHAEGEIIDIETSPETANYLYPKNGVLTHSNHFVEGRSVQSLQEQKWPDSIFRANRLKRLINNSGRDINITDIQSALQDHFSKPKSICRHSSTPSGAKMCTKASLVMDLNERRLLATDGPPCSNNYQEFAVS